MADFSIKRGDREPSIQCQLLDGLGQPGQPVNLTGATVKFIMRDKINASATIVTPTSGIVSYAWGSTDTDVSGLYEAEWEVTWGSGKKQTFPSQGYLAVKVFSDLG